MANSDALIGKHYAVGGLLDRILAGLESAGKAVDALAVDDLAPIDAFHTRGREATIEVAGLANLDASDQVLDVGCGLGGTARHLAERFGCRVVGVDLTEEYIAVGKKLTELVGLHDRVEFRHGSALALPYGNERFDVVWTEHAQMNIADKPRFYAEIARVLRPGGRFLFHDVFRGGGEDPVYPAPWAEDDSISALATEPEARATMEQVELDVDQWIGKVPESIEFFEQVMARVAAEGPPPIGIHVLMGDNAKEKLRNHTRNLRENRVSVAMGIARKRAAG
jgi:ubiquinone/menaquinone biosynthesis C-methylase UbiE